MDPWNDASLGLLGCRLGNGLVTLHLILFLLSIQFDHTVLHLHRNDLIHSKLHAFFNDGLHTASLGKSLKEIDLLGELCIPRLLCNPSHHHII